MFDCVWNTLRDVSKILTKFSMVFVEAFEEFLLKTGACQGPTTSNFLNKILGKARNCSIWSVFGFEQFRSRQKGLSLTLPPPLRVSVKFFLNEKDFNFSRSSYFCVLILMPGPSYILYTINCYKITFVAFWAIYLISKSTSWKLSNFGSKSLMQWKIYFCFKEES